jgi:hypothetical protein
MTDALRKKYPPERVRAIRERFDQDVQAWQKIQEEGAKDIEAISTERGPWPEAEWNLRHKKGAERPCLHEDILTQYVNLVVNQIEGNPMGIDVQPGGDGADEDTAKFREDRIRAIEYETNASHAYLTAAKNAIERSYGFWKLETAYRNAQGQQRMCIESVMDPDSVIPGYAKKPDWSDMRDCWEMDRMTHEEFRRKYPKAALTDFSGLIKEAPQWIDTETIQVAAWWHLDDDEPESDEREAQQNDETGDDGVKTRKRATPKVCKTIFNGVEALDETEFPDPGDEDNGIAPEIPILVVTGRIKYERGTRVIESLVRKGRTGQLLYDYIISAIQEVIALAPKVKWIGYEGQFDTGTPWEKLHRTPIAFAEAKAHTEEAGGEQQPLPLPQFVSYEPPVQALEMAKQSVLIGVQNAIGISSTERQDRAAKSGKALEQLQQDMSTATSHYFRALRIAQERGYRIINRVLEKLEGQGEGQTVALRDVYGKHSVQQVRPDQYRGKHTVVIGSGKLYQSQQEEQSDFAESLLKIAAPEILLAVLPGAIRMKGLGEYGEELAKMIESIQPPPMQQARQQQGQIDPMAQQAISQAQQHLQAINHYAQQLEQQIQEYEAEKRGKVVDNQFKLELARIQQQTALGVAEINASVKENIAQLEAEMERIGQSIQGFIQAQDQAHTADENALDRQHDAALQDQAQQHQATLQDQAQAHAQDLQTQQIGADQQAQAAATEAQQQPPQQ